MTSATALSLCLLLCAASPRLNQKSLHGSLAYGSVTSLGTVPCHVCVTEGQTVQIWKIFMCNQDLRGRWTSNTDSKQKNIYYMIPPTRVSRKRTPVSRAKRGTGSQCMLGSKFGFCMKTILGMEKYLKPLNQLLKSG